MNHTETPRTRHNNSNTVRYDNDVTSGPSGFSIEDLGRKLSNKQSQRQTMNHKKCTTGGPGSSSGSSSNSSRYQQHLSRMQQQQQLRQTNCLQVDDDDEDDDKDDDEEEEDENHHDTDQHAHGSVAGAATPLYESIDASRLTIR